MKMIIVALLKFVMGLARQAIPRLFNGGFMAVGSFFSLREATREALASPISNADMIYMHSQPFYNQTAIDYHTLLANIWCQLHVFVGGMHTYYFYHYVQAMFMARVLIEIIEKFGIFTILKKKLVVFKKSIRREWAKHHM